MVPLLLQSRHPIKSGDADTQVVTLPSEAGLTTFGTKSLTEEMAMPP